MRETFQGDLGAAMPVGARSDWLGSLLQPVVLGSLARWQVGRLTLHLPGGDVRVVGDPGAEPHATIRIAHPRFFRDFALGGDLGAGESYMRGHWQADDLPALIELVIANLGAIGGDSWLSRLLNAPNDLRHRLRRNTRAGSRRNIGAHYDLSNDFFALFLDPTMTYSCAFFESADEPLDVAQRRKISRLVQHLDLRPEHQVLEIGCGWGALAIHLARTHGCRVTGVTISREQHALATARVREAGLGDLIDIRLCDYRDVSGRFDRIVSVEMLEAVGREHWPTFFETCDRVLAPGGRAAIQTISIPDHRFERYAKHCDWVQKYIFPGGLLPSLGELCRAMARRTSLTVRHLDDIGPHYAETLKRWRGAFLSQVGRVRAMGFDDRFIRMWDFYLASCEAAFRSQSLGNLQIVVARDGGEAVAAGIQRV